MIISESTPITAGNTGVFVCVAHGCPVPSLTWSRDGTPLGNSPRSTILEELVNENGVTFVQSILVICSLEQDDTAQYNCSASNNISFASASFNLTVNCKYVHLKIHVYYLMVKKAIWLDIVLLCFHFIFVCSL